MKPEEQGSPSVPPRPHTGADIVVLRAPRTGVRLDRVVADGVGCSRRRARSLIRAGRVSVNTRVTLHANALSAGDEVRVTPVEDKPEPRENETPAIRILWRGNDVWVIAKPAGLHTHRGRSPMSLANALIAINDAFATVAPTADEGGLVHRLDRDTSGLVLAATSRETYVSVRRQFTERAVEKQYLALVVGSVERALSIDRPLARRTTRVVPARRRDRSLHAITIVRPLEQGAWWSLVEVVMMTGVTHQIRAHLALAGHPIIGDVKYGGPPAPPGTRDGHLLHARSILLPDRRAFAAAVPADFLRALAILRREP